MDPYAKPGERRVGANKPRYRHLPPDALGGTTARDRRKEKEAVAAERRAIKKAARRRGQEQLRSELDQGGA